MTEQPIDMRAVILAPSGRDADLLCSFIARLGIRSEVLQTVPQLCDAIRAGAGAAIVAEEGLRGDGIKLLEPVLSDQPSWSDFPLIILTSGGRVTAESERLRALREPLGNIVVVERPARPETLSSTLETALRSRARQYQIRDQIRQAALAQDALIKAEKLAVTGRLAASIAHEINNPLEGVVNLLYLIRLENSLEKVKLYASEAEREIARVSEITKHTLRFYKEPTNAINIDVAAVAESVLSLYQSRLNASDIAVKVKVPKTPLFVYARAGELRQVLANLVGNALDAMRSGGRLSIHLWSTHSGAGGTQRVRLTIADSGPGIPKSMLSTVFEPFVTTKGETGTGLGLWVTSELIKKNNWKLRLRSSCGGDTTGTVFTMIMAGAAPKPDASNHAQDKGLHNAATSFVFPAP